jgi:protein-tyrosine phosphatase
VVVSRARTSPSQSTSASGHTDVDWLSESLALGGAFAAEGVEQLALEHGITHVVDLRAEACDEESELARHGISLLHLPTEDMRAVTPEMLAKGVGWVRRALAPKRRGRVLIHCQHGIGRSALLAMCVLVDGGMAPLDAMALAKDARPVVSPSPEQLQAFIEFVAVRQALFRADWEVPSLAALGTIAYRHLAAAGAPRGP